MPRHLLLALALLPACGPSPADPTTSVATNTGAATDTGDPGTTSTGTGSTPTSTAPLPTTTASTTLDDSTTTDPSTDPGTTLEHSFVTSHDAGNQDSCDAFAQNCPPDQKCVAIDGDGSGTWTVLSCVPINGNVPPDLPCTAPDGPFAGNDDCSASSICWHLDADNHGTCRSLCTGSNEQPACFKPKSCISAGGGLVHVCVPSCHPLTEDCAQGLCLPDNGFFSCVDTQPGSAALNALCEFDIDCSKGLVCIDGATASLACDPQFGCCQPYCEFPGGPCPNPDQTCQQWLPPKDPPLGTENVGFCATPP